MAWSTLPTYSDGNILTGAQLMAIKGNIEETAPAKATATGRMFISTGANTLAERVPQVSRVVGGAQNTLSATFTDLLTVGPTCTSVATGSSAIFAISAFILNTTAGQGGYMGVAVSGATTIAADVTRALRVMSETASTNQKMSYVGMFAGTLTPGNNTFQAKYSVVNTGQANFDERELLLLPL